MGLHVRLVDQVEPQLVAQLGQVFVMGVVRGADRVQVVRLHQLQVAARQVGGDRPAPFWVVLVQVDAVQQDGRDR